MTAAALFGFGQMADMVERPAVPAETKKPAAEGAPLVLSKEQRDFLAEFSANYVAGRRIACWAARAIVAIGVVAGGVTGIIELVQHIPALLR